MYSLDQGPEKKPSKGRGDFLVGYPILRKKSHPRKIPIPKKPQR